ncbi:MAG: type III pantothenate kinase [Alphaproteobacteria bacterium]
MLLAIDSGNTNAVFGVFDGMARRGEWRASTDPARTADEYAVWLTQLMSLDGLARKDVDAAIIANVVPATAHALTVLCRRYFGCRPMIVGEDGVVLGITVRLPNPAEVGADRLVNAVAAHARYPGCDKIIVDFGTATTFDVVDKSGAYAGGVIAPGPNLSLEALYMAAAKLPGISIRRPSHVIGTATVPAMQSGVYWGYVGLIEGLVQRMKTEFGGPMTVIATGGLSSLFADATKVIDTVDPELTMLGLLDIHRRNAKP